MIEEAVRQLEEIQQSLSVAMMMDDKIKQGLVLIAIQSKTRVVTLMLKQHISNG